MITIPNSAEDELLEVLKAHREKRMVPPEPLPEPQPQWQEDSPPEPDSTSDE